MGSLENPEMGRHMAGVGDLMEAWGWGGVQAKRRERKPQGGAEPTRRLAEWPTWCVWRIRFPFTQDSAQTSLTDSPVTSH